MCSVNPFTLRVRYGDIRVILTSEFVDEILSRAHSNETSSAALSHGTIYIEVFYTMKFGDGLKFGFKALFCSLVCLSELLHFSV